MVLKGGDVDVEVDRGTELPSVLLLEGLLIVDISLNKVRVRAYPFSAQTWGASLLHCISGGRESEDKYLDS